MNPSRETQPRWTGNDRDASGFEMLGKQPPATFDGGTVEVLKGFVEKPQGRAVEQCSRPPEPLQQARGELVRAAGGWQAEQLRRLVRDFPGQMPHPREERQVLEHRQLAVIAQAGSEVRQVPPAFLGREEPLAFPGLDLSTIRPEQPGQATNQGGLSRPVRSPDEEGLAWTSGTRGSRQRSDATEVTGEVTKAEGDAMHPAQDYADQTLRSATLPGGWAQAGRGKGAGEAGGGGAGCTGGEPEPPGTPLPAAIPA